jgi:MscS family membrane protein
MTTRACEPLATIDRLACRGGSGLCRLAVALLLSLSLTTAIAADIEHESPLKPPDRSSPRAALKTFLDSADAVAEFLAREYLPSTSREGFRRLIRMSKTPVEGLDLSALSPAARLKGSRAAAFSLYEVLSRIELPPLDQIPDEGELPPPAGDGEQRWVIPDTEIALVRMKDGPQAGQFLFGTHTVARVEEFYELMRHLPYRRPFPVPGVKELIVTGGGWMIPYRWIKALPAPMRAPLADQALWKWIATALVLLVLFMLLRIAYRMSRSARERSPFKHSLAQLAMPIFVLLAAPVVVYLLLVQINLIEGVGITVGIVGTTIMFIASAWLAWRVSSAVAEAIISSPKIAAESIDAHLIRVSLRLLGIIGSATFLAVGANELGIPVYGIVAGLGVGGLAIALAAQPTIENLIGGLNLFADKPIRVGEFCKYGGDIGTVEAIGIRSTRIRGIDRTVTTIPNAALAKMPIVNFTRRDRMLLHTMICLRYETTPEQLRYVLVKLREMLLGHPRVDPDPARARLSEFAMSALAIEVFAYVRTGDWGEFLAIREDLMLRILSIIEESGTSIAYPSQTLYLGRDQGTDEGRVRAAEAAVRAWRDEGALPFPDFSPEQVRQLRGSVTYPPPGSTAAGRPGVQAGSSAEPKAAAAAQANVGKSPG